MAGRVRQKPAPGQSDWHGRPQVLGTKTERQLCSRRVSEPGYTPRGRGGEKRTCSRPRRTTYLPLCAGLPALTLQAATVARSSVRTMLLIRSSGLSYPRDMVRHGIELV